MLITIHNMFVYILWSMVSIALLMVYDTRLVFVTKAKNILN